MIKNNFKIAWRNLVKNKVYSFINVGGLAVGMSVAMLIGLWLFDELSFDKATPNYDRIVQVMQHQTFDGTFDHQHHDHNHGGTGISATVYSGYLDVPMGISTFANPRKRKNTRGRTVGAPAAIIIAFILVGIIIAVAVILTGRHSNQITKTMAKTVNGTYMLPDDDFTGETNGNDDSIERINKFDNYTTTNPPLLRT